MASTNQTGAATSTDVRSPLFPLSRQLAHDLDNVWSRIFELIQQAKEMPRLQSREDVLGQLNETSSAGLLLSRNVMQALAHSDVAPQVFDACNAVREWMAENENALQDILAFSCLVPSYPLHIRLPPSALRLMLLSMVGYALHSEEGKRWVMLGVRSTKGDGRTKEDATDGADVMFVCSQDDARTSMSYSLRQRADAIQAVVKLYGGTVQTCVVAQVGVNVRIHFPLAPV